MKKLITTIFLIFLGVSSLGAQPKIVIEGNDVYNWGKINPKGKPLKAKVKIFNKGNKVLEIEEVKPGCGCTTAPLDKNKIKPNDYATLDITLKVTSDGHVNKSINITSNDPKNPRKKLSLKADIQRPVRVSNHYLVLKDMKKGKSSATNIELKNNTKKDIKIVDVVNENADFKTNLKKNSILPASKSVKFEVSYTPKNEGNISDKILLKTNNKEMETIELSVFGYFEQTKTSKKTESKDKKK